VVLTFGLALASGAALAGYDVHITRKAQWSDDTGPRITIGEWLDYVKSDPEVKRDPLNSANDFIVTSSSESFPMWFEPSLGELRMKDPSDKALSKLIEIAKKMHARLQGDDGEIYPLKP
jgi:hypothetical protein